MKGQKVVYIGEIGLKENTNQANTYDKTQALWDSWMAVYMKHDVPYVFQWALYDNELIKHDPEFHPGKTYKFKDLKGMWLIRPDGTKSHSQKYFDLFLQKASKATRFK